jgi:hypothetical protein
MTFNAGDYILLKIYAQGCATLRGLFFCLNDYIISVIYPCQKYLKRLPRVRNVAHPLSWLEAAHGTKNIRYWHLDRSYQGCAMLRTLVPIGLTKALTKRKVQAKTMATPSFPSIQQGEIAFSF